MSILSFISSFLTTTFFLFLLLHTIFQPVPPPAPPVNNEAATTSSSDLSRNWAGYSASGGKFTQVKGTWTVPHVNTTTFGADATWVGIGGVASEDLIQAGTQATVNEYGQVAYAAFYEDLPEISQPIPLVIHAGDTVEVTVQKQEADMWNIVIKNNTTGENFSTQLAYHSSLSSADWIEEAPSGLHHIMPLDNFGKITISHASAVKDGKTASLSQAQARPIAMSMTGNATLADASSLGSDGASFNIKRNSDSSVGQTITYRLSNYFPIVIYRHFHFNR